MADDNKENGCHLDSEINTLTVNILKDYLRRHNQNVTGKKAELALRAKGVSKLEKAVGNLWESGRESIRTTTDRKVSDPAWREAPPPFSLMNWVQDLFADPIFHRGVYLQLLCIENGDKKVVEG